MNKFTYGRKRHKSPKFKSDKKRFIKELERRGIKYELLDKEVIQWSDRELLIVK